MGIAAPHLWLSEGDLGGYGISGDPVIRGKTTHKYLTLSPGEVTLQCRYKYAINYINNGFIAWGGPSTLKLRRTSPL